jgi:hypothetical protein
LRLWAKAAFRNENKRARGLLFQAKSRASIFRVA